MKVGEFGDARRAAVGARFVDRMVAKRTVVIRRLGEDRGEELSFHRFLSSPEVEVGEIIETAARRTARASAGRRVLAVQDTTEVNFAGRDRGRRGLGPAGDGKSLGFFIHTVVVVDIEDEAVLGVADAQIWTRSGEPVGPRRARGLKDKESVRWLKGSQAAAEALSRAKQVVVVCDREGDIYGQFAHRPAGVDLIVRAANDRALQAEGEHLFAASKEWVVLKAYEVKVMPRRPGERARTARVALRAGSVTICRPRNTADKTDPKTVTLTLVEALETDPPPGVEPLHWRLLTTLSVTDAKDAAEVVQLYRLRWRIEQVFRALKSDGVGLEEAQIEDAHRLFKLAALALVAAVQTIQLVDARDGSPRPATDVVDKQMLQAAHAILPTLERSTARQRNPHPPDSLAWLAWIVARLGGWHCYYKPPGPKTMRLGLTRFHEQARGYFLAKPDL